jgi:hypothetical protein
MSEQDTASLRAAADRAERNCRVLEETLTRVAPANGRPWPLRLGSAAKLRAADYSDTDEGRARYLLDLTTARETYLRSRWDEIQARRQRREQAGRDRALGIARFIDGDRSHVLDNLDADSRAELARERAAERVERIRERTSP